MTVENTHPQILVGEHLDEKDSVVFKVAEGDFTDTTFNYKSVDMVGEGDDKNLQFSVDFFTFFHKGEEATSHPPQFVIQKFYETVAGPFLDGIIRSKEKAPE